MAKIDELDNRIKHLQHLQRKTSDPVARVNLTLELTETLSRYNQERKRLNEGERHRQIFDKNLDQSKDIFNKLARGRRVI